MEDLNRVSKYEWHYGHYAHHLKFDHQVQGPCRLCSEESILIVRSINMKRAEVKDRFICENCFYFLLFMDVLGIS